MKLENFLYELDDKGILLLTVNNPQARNAMNALAWDELGAVMEDADRNPAVRVIIITGAGDKAFVAGADLNVMAERKGADVLGGGGQKAVTKIENCAKPVIAAVNGYAFGGGCEITLGCDIRICSENARFCLPEVGLGILPGCGGTQRLAKLIGLGRAKEMVLTGRAVKPDEALQIGLVTKVVPLENLLDEARAIAEMILQKGPVAVRLTKRMLQASLSTDQETGMLLEVLSLGVLCGTEDKDEGVRSALEKRAPVFKGK